MGEVRPWVRAWSFYEKYETPSDTVYLCSRLSFWVLFRGLSTTDMSRPLENTYGSTVVCTRLNTRDPGATRSAGASLLDQFICEIASNLFMLFLMLCTVLTVLASLAEAKADDVAMFPAVRVVPSDWNWLPPMEGGRVDLKSPPPRGLPSQLFV